MVHLKIKKHFTVKPEITHTLGGCKKVWVITGYGFSQVCRSLPKIDTTVNPEITGGNQFLWVIKDYGFSQV